MRFTPYLTQHYEEGGSTSFPLGIGGGYHTIHGALAAIKLEAMRLQDDMVTFDVVDQAIPLTLPLWEAQRISDHARGIVIEYEADVEIPF